MNKTIKELFQKAGGVVEVCDVTRDEVLTYSENCDPEKFAELIIKECKRIIQQEWYDENNTEPNDDARSIAIHVGKKSGLMSALNCINQNFGIK